MTEKQQKENEKGESNELAQRSMMGSLAICLVAGFIGLSQISILQPLFCLFIASVIAIGLWEYCRIAEQMGYEPRAIHAIVWSFVYVFCVYGSLQSPDWAHAPPAALMLFLFTLFSYYFFLGTKPLINIALLVFGFAYITMTLTCMVNIAFAFPKEGFEDGRCWLFYLIAVTKISDMAGYFVGKAYGKRKLAEHLSPGKTVEGAIAGIVAALATSVLLYLWLNNDGPDTSFSLTFEESLRLGLMLGIIGLVGDLAESLIKRDAGVKDSNQIPGLGGVLDTLDSLLFATPVLYMFLYVR